MRYALVVALFVVGGCSSSSSKPMPIPDPLVTGLRVTQVIAYQGLRATLVKDGQPATPEVPLIQGRATMLRVFLTPDAGWDGREVIVRLALSSGGMALPPVEVHSTLAAASAESDLASTANFDLAPDQVTADLTWAVSLHEIAAGLQPMVADGAQYPADGTAVALGAKDTGVGEKVVVIPIQYNADGSGRLPDTDATQIDLLRARMLALYPVKNVDITIGAPLPWSKAVKANGSGWGALLQAVINQRISDGVPHNVYYYGMFAPAASMQAFCGQGCVAGLSPASPDPDDEYARGSIGLGYADKIAESDVTFVHEVGHAHGRQHAPCMVQDPDANYPYPDGEIGDWGYDMVAKKLLDPAGKVRDMMGYCAPVWISDYTYKALYDRVVYLNQVPQSLLTPQRWRSVLVDGEHATRGDVVSVRRTGGVERTVERTLADDSVEQVKAHYYPFDHLPGGLLLVPEEADLGTLRFDGHLIR